jgi:hypothetical protein
VLAVGGMVDDAYAFGRLVRSIWLTQYNNYHQNQYMKRYGDWFELTARIADSRKSTLRLIRFTRESSESSAGCNDVSLLAPTFSPRSLTCSNASDRLSSVILSYDAKASNDKTTKTTKHQKSEYMEVQQTKYNGNNKPDFESRTHAHLPSGIVIQILETMLPSRGRTWRAKGLV